MVAKITCMFLLAEIIVAVDWNVRTPLDEYVNRPDPTYQWRELASYSEESCDMYILNMTSQTWKDDSVTSNPVWSHHLVVSLPKADRYQHKDAAFLWIGGGKQTDQEPNPDDGDFFLTATCEYARDVGVATGYLKQIPNQPFVFKKDPDFRPKSEDALIAFTWRSFLENTSDPEILLRMPMVKATIRAMDTISALARQKDNQTDVTKFFVSGASKRGWTAWMTAATDRRVHGVAPLVLTALHMQPNLMHHYRAYGGWSFAFNDYYRENVTVYINSPKLQDMANVIDPYEYRERLTMPKVVVCAAGDEFFLPDDSNYFYKDLPEPKYMMLLDNTHHGVTLSELRVYEAVAAFNKAILTGYKMPKLWWERYQVEDDAGVVGTTVLRTDTEPEVVTSWQADTDEEFNRRDFRWADADGLRLILWEEFNTTRTEGMMEWRAEINEAQGVWRGLIVNAIFKGPPELPEDMQFDFTTEVNIVPDTFPYAPCQGDECRGELV